MRPVPLQDEGDKLVIFERGDLVFVFNFHPTNSYSDYRVGCKNPGDYKVQGSWATLQQPLSAAGMQALHDFTGRASCFPITSTSMQHPNLCWLAALGSAGKV